MKKNLQEMEVKAINKSAILESHDGEEFSLITVAKNVLCEDGTTMQDYFDSHSEPNISTKIVNSNSMSKVGQGDNVDFSDNVMNGAYEDVVLKGKSLVNVIQEPSSQDVVLPYSFEEGERATINDTHSNGRVEIEVKGRTLVNLAKVRSVDAYNKCLDRNIPIKPNTKYIGIFKATYYQETGGNYACFMTSTVSVGDDPSYNGDHIYSISCPDGLGTEHKLNKGDQQFTFTSKSNEQYLHIRTGGGKGFTYEDMIVLEYQEGMENWDIPYFEGMASVRMPTLHTVGKNLAKFTTDQKEVLLDSAIETTRTLTLDVDELLTIVNKNVGKRICLAYEVETSEETTYGHHAIDLRPEFEDGTTVWWATTPKRNGTVYRSHVIAQKVKQFLNKEVFFRSAKGTGRIYNVRIWISDADTDTTYEAHKSSILSLPEEVVLRGIGDVKDTLNLTTGEYVQRIGSITANELEASDYYKSDLELENTIQFGMLTRGREKLRAKTNAKSVCNIIPIMFGNDDVFHARVDGGTPYGSFTIWMDKTKLETEDVFGLIKWLRDNNAIIQYELATPIVTKINLSSTLKSWNTTTHIYSEIPENTLYPTLSHSNPTYPVILKPSTKYSIVANSYSNGHTNSAINFNLGGATASTTVGNRVTTITTSSTLSNELLTMSGRGNKLNNVMVIEGDVAGDEPYFEGVCDSKSPILSNVGKNISPINTYETTVWAYAQGYQGFDRVLVKNIMVDENKTYTLTFDKECESGLPSHLGDIQVLFSNSPAPSNYTGHNAIYTHCRNNSGKRYAHITMPNIGAGSNYIGKKVTLTNIQLRESSTLATYEPYKSNTVTFDQKDGKTIVLRSLPNGVCDTLDVRTGEYVQNIREITLNGSEDWQGLSPVEGNDSLVRFYTGNQLGVKPSSKVNFICDKFKMVDNAVATASGECVFNNSVSGGFPNGIQFQVLKEKATTVGEWRTYLSQNPVTVQYELATPIVKQVNVEGYPYAYENGHVLLKSGSQEQSLTPTIEYSIVANRGGQIRSNQRMVERHQKKLDSLYAMTLVNMIDSQYNQTLMELKSDLPKSEVRTWDIE